MSKKEPGGVYEALTRLLELDEKKNRIIGVLAAAICQQYGAEAMPEGIGEEIEKAVMATEDIRRDYG